MRLQPKISVVMTVYNTEKYLKEAINSVLNQTFENFEYILINDASTDNSLEILQSFRDKRLRIVNNPVNMGVAASSNIGLDMARGTYVIRMDSDDISLPHRFETQLNYMEDHPDIGVVGSWVRCFGDQTDDYVWEFPLQHHEIRANQIFNPKIHHSSIIMRKSLLDRYHLRYNPRFTRSLDYEFYVRHADKLTFANLNEVLLLYRRHPEQISTGYFNEQQQLAGEVRLSELGKLGITPNEREFLLHQMLSIGSFRPDREFVDQSRSWLEKLWFANKQAAYYSQNEFEKVLAIKWTDVCSAVAVRNEGLAGEIWTRKFYEFPLHDKAPLPENEIKPVKLQDLARGVKNVVIFGTGRVALNLYAKLKSKYDVIAFIDNNKEVQEKTVFGIPVMSMESFIQCAGKNPVVILSSILGNHDQTVMNKIADQCKDIQAIVLSWKDLL